jgi:hypothetical protein
MTARFRAENRMTPRLDTAFVANPRPVSDVKEYRPGLRHTLPYQLHEPSLFAHTIQTEYGTYTHQFTAIPGTTTTEPWSTLSTKVFELYGNDPIIYGTLQALIDTATGTSYAFGYPLPARSGTFKPVVTFTQ